MPRSPKTTTTRRRSCTRLSKSRPSGRLFCVGPHPMAVQRPGSRTYETNCRLFSEAASERFQIISWPPWSQTVDQWVVNGRHIGTLECLRPQLRTPESSTRICEGSAGRQPVRGGFLGLPVDRRIPSLHDHPRAYHMTRRARRRPVPHQLVRGSLRNASFSLASRQLQGSWRLAQNQWSSGVATFRAGGSGEDRVDEP